MTATRRDIADLMGLLAAEEMRRIDAGDRRSGHHIADAILREADMPPLDAVNARITAMLLAGYGTARYQEDDGG